MRLAVARLVSPHLKPVTPICPLGGLCASPAFSMFNVFCTHSLRLPAKFPRSCHWQAAHRQHGVCDCRHSGVLWRRACTRDRCLAAAGRCPCAAAASAWGFTRRTRATAHPTGPCMTGKPAFSLHRSPLPRHAGLPSLLGRPFRHWQWLGPLGMPLHSAVAVCGALVSSGGCCASSAAFLRGGLLCMRMRMRMHHGCCADAALPGPLWLGRACGLSLGGRSLSRPRCGRQRRGRPALPSRCKEAVEGLRGGEQAALGLRVAQEGCPGRAAQQRACVAQHPQRAPAVSTLAILGYFCIRWVLQIAAGQPGYQYQQLAMCRARCCTQQSAQSQ